MKDPGSTLTYPTPRYNLSMPPNFEEVRQLALELPYDEWFRAGVEEALVDTSEDIPHEEAMKHFHEAIHKARKLID
ncbi:MAG: hypothetical protein WDM87_00990 [Terracidiphilus sp.]